MAETAVVDDLVALAAEYADGVILALPEVESEQQLHEGLAGAFLAFWEDASRGAFKEGQWPQHRTGTPVN